MSIESMIVYAVPVIVFALLIYWLGEFVGGTKQRELWQDHMDRCNRYIHAVDDLDRWCGHTSPHARLIARHIRAKGEGLEINAGTPASTEACTINGLREQLKFLDRAAAETSRESGRGG